MKKQEGEFKKRILALLVADEEHNLFPTLADKQEVLKILDEAKQDFYSKFQIEKNQQGKNVVKTSIKHPSNELAELILKWFGEAEK